jgi:hypothetical protein
MIIGILFFLSETAPCIYGVEIVELMIIDILFFSQFIPPTFIWFIRIASFSENFTS